METDLLQADSMPYLKVLKMYIQGPVDQQSSWNPHPKNYISVPRITLKEV
jgi:hypothetical protein